MFYISLLCMRFFWHSESTRRSKNETENEKKKICVIRIAMQKKVKCQTVVGL